MGVAEVVHICQDRTEVRSNRFQDDAVFAFRTNPNVEEHLVPSGDAE